MVAACANLAGGAASDALVRRLGAKPGRRLIGATALTAAAAFTVAAMLTHYQVLTVVFLALTYGTITFQQSGVFGVCLDIGGQDDGSVHGSLRLLRLARSIILVLPKIAGWRQAGHRAAPVTGRRRSPAGGVDGSEASWNRCR